MSKTNYDSQFCGSLPLAHINQIQSYGFLLATDLQLNIVQVSDNQQQHLGIEPPELTKQSLLNIIDHSSQEELKKELRQVKSRAALTLKLKNAAGEMIPYLTLIHRKENYLVFEFEKELKQQKSFFEVYQAIREAASTIQGARDLGTALAAAASELKRISGFDKVMIYKFDSDWNGLVLAEAMEPGMESYLDLHFPASDIPRQARELYKINPYRQIPDVNFVPVKLWPVINPVTSAFIDLSDCNLRSVTRVHIEYLKNMNVAASMSTRIIKDNELWGLISCHHREAKFLSYQECSVFELLSDIISSKLTSMEIRQDSEYIGEQQKVLSVVMEGIIAGRNLKSGVHKSAGEIMQMLRCSGVAYCRNLSAETSGSCPDSDMMEKILVWLQTKSLRQIFYTSELIEHFDEAARITEIASGLIAIPIDADNAEFLLAFRGETPHAIRWGGNPEEAIQFEADKSTYHPRNSFALWREEIRNTSKPFTKNDLFYAGELHRILLGKKITEINRN